MSHPLHILGISGSLRSQSTNSLLLASLKHVLPSTVSFSIYNGLESLPHFNPELEEPTPPATVVAFRKELAAADAVVFCTPEYAFGLPGALKDGLDWIVSSGEFTNKPVVLISASPLATGGEKALVSLETTIKVMGAKIPDGGTVAIPFIVKKIDKEGAVTDKETSERLQQLMDVLIEFIPENKKTLEEM